MIYFDYNSTAPYSPSVREYLQSGIINDWQNPFSVYPQAQILNQKIKECRKAIADHLNCSAKHLFFTSGGTESINTVLSPETLRLNQMSVIISSFLEHHASLKRIQWLMTAPRYIQHNKQGEINLSELEETCKHHPHSLLSFLSANNETGVINNVREISKIAKKYNCFVHIDAVQSLGKTYINLEDWDVDFVSFSGHKIGAMKGIGLLYAKKPFAPLMQGGGQEKGLRPGTYNFPAIYSLKLAIQDIDFSKWENIRKLRDDFENSLLCKIGSGKEESYNLSNDRLFHSEKKQLNLSRFEINCREASRLPNTTSLYCGPGASGQAVLLFLAQRGIAVSTGSACNTGSPEPSHVLTALADLKDLGDPRAYANSCIRISFSPYNTKKEVDFLKKAFYDLQSMSYQPNEPLIGL